MSESDSMSMVGISSSSSSSSADGTLTVMEGNVGFAAMACVFAISITGLGRLGKVEAAVD